MCFRVPVRPRTPGPGHVLPPRAQGAGHQRGPARTVPREPPVARPGNGLRSAAGDREDQGDEHQLVHGRQRRRGDRRNQGTRRRQVRACARTHGG